MHVQKAAPATAPATSRSQAEGLRTSTHTCGGADVELRQQLAHPSARGPRVLVARLSLDIIVRPELDGRLGHDLDAIRAIALPKREQPTRAVNLAEALRHCEPRRPHAARRTASGHEGTGSVGDETHPRLAPSAAALPRADPPAHAGQNGHEPRQA